MSVFFVCVGVGIFLQLGQYFILANFHNLAKKKKKKVQKVQRVCFWEGENGPNSPYLKEK